MAGFHIRGFNTKRAVIILTSVVIIYSLLLAILMNLERDVPGSKLVSTLDAIWYLMETLTTVGYGDILPVSYWGRMIGLAF